MNGKPEAMLDSPVIKEQPRAASVKEQSSTTHTLAKSLKKKLKNYFSNRMKTKCYFQIPSC